MKLYIKELIKQSIEQLWPEQASEVLGVSEFDVSVPDMDRGDFSSNVAMVLFKKFNVAPASNPAEFAQMLVGQITKLDHGDTFAEVSAVGGFINFIFSDKFLNRTLNQVLDQKNIYGQSEIGENKKILLEYFQPNVAKPLHLGHLRTAIIGDALFRVLKFAGFDVASDTHLGDWGTQFGLLLLAYKKWGDAEIIAKDPIAELNKLYIQINAEIESNPELREQGKQEFVKLEQGDEENRELWKKFRDWSWQEYNVIYDDLGVRRSDHDWPESFYIDKMPDVIKNLEAKGLLRESQGAQIVDLEEYNLGIAIVVKSDGGTTYLLRDLATYIYRQAQGYEQQLYVVDNRQAHTLAQTFKILELLGVITSPEQAIHIAFGYLSLPEGAMSTRKGTVISANDLIAKAQGQALEIIEQKNPDLQNKPEVAKQVMQAAVKYFDLSHNYKSDIVFEWDKALTFDGNTGPYLQYTHARINGILRKVDKPVSAEMIEDVLIEPSAKNVLRKLTQFSGIIEQVAQNYSPNLLASYLFELSQQFNSFYEAVPIAKETNQAKQDFYLQIIAATAQVLSNGLELLGIKAPEQM
ncbi:MAG: arginine--tRNA ligase [Candidatus Doudnabacteria bacterium]